MRYQKIESRIWHDEKFTTLTPMQQRLFFYILTCHHNNLIGFYVLKPGYACEDLSTNDSTYSPKDFDKDLRKLLEKGLIKYDFEVSVLLIKNFLKHNPITNPNQKKAAEKHLIDLPKTKLIQDFIELNQMLWKGLTKGLEEVLLKPETESETYSETGLYISPPQKPSKKSSQKLIPTPTPKFKTSIPEDFGISEGILTWAAKNGFTRLNEHLEAFKDIAESRGYQYISWDAAFKRAIREDWGKINERPPLPASRQSPTNSPPKNLKTPDPKCSACKGEGVAMNAGKFKPCACLKEV